MSTRRPFLSVRLLHRAVAVLVLSTTMVLAPGALTPAGAQTASASDMEREFLSILNQERRDRGLAALVEDPSMASVAREWSSTMSTSHLHHRPDLREQVERRVTTEWRRIGENVGRGGSVARLHQAFMDSPGHFDNIVGPYNRLGVGVVQSGSTIWVTFNFLDGPEIAAPASAPASHPSFDDVSEGTYYYGAVDWAWKGGVAAGTAPRTFSPVGPLTRAQAVTFLWRAAGSPDGAAHHFEDVPAGAYFEQAVAWASEKGITGGTSPTTFSPHDRVSRAQMVTFQWREAGQPRGGSHPFTDVPAGSYYEGAVSWASATGITSGATATRFNPMSGVTRSQSVTFLWRAAGTPA